MKIIYYIGGFELPDKNAAAQRVVPNAKALRDLGYKVIFIDIDRECHKSILKTKTECLGFTRFSVTYTNKRLVSDEDFRTVVRKYPKPYAVIAYNYPAIALEKIRKFCQKRGIRIISDCTEWYGPQGEDLLHKAIKGIDSYLRMNVIQPKLDGIIVISKYLNDFYKDKLPTVHIPPLVDKSDKKWNVERTPHDGIVITYAGSPLRGKDKINRIVEALYRIENTDAYVSEATELIDKNSKNKVTFKVIGITKQQFLDMYPEDERYLSDNIVFLGRIPHVDVIKETANADFSMFYRNVNRITMAGFPTKLSESISCGTPVITNPTSNISDYLADGVNGLLVKASIETTLKYVSKMSMSEVAGIKNNVISDIFDYRKYSELLLKLL